MKSGGYVLICSTVLAAACTQSADNGSANLAASNTAAPVKKHAYCFFKDDEMKGWKASRDRHGDITVAGEAHVKDPRYKATITKVEVGPKKVIVIPTITENDTGYATNDNWWHVSIVAPNSASLNEAEVQCGDKSVAVLEVPAKV
jgi:hypothetical protein